MLCIYKENYILFMFIWHMVITVVIPLSRATSIQILQLQDTYILYIFCSKVVYSQYVFAGKKVLFYFHTHILSRSPFLHYTFFSTKLHFLVCLAWIWVKTVNKEKKRRALLTQTQCTGIAESTQIPGSWPTQLYYT